MANSAALAEDDEGHLWIGTADSSDSGSDGVYRVTAATTDPQLVLADQHTVLGLLWYDDELFVASKERIDASSGFDGTVFATHRAVVEFASGVGQVNGIVVSLLPDGTDLRVVVAGVRAPVGLTYVPGTDDSSSP